jgi:hypothetical protein
MHVCLHIYYPHLLRSDPLKLFSHASTVLVLSFAYIYFQSSRSSLYIWERKKEKSQPWPLHVQVVVLKGDGFDRVYFKQQPLYITSPPFFFSTLRRRHKHQQPKFWFIRCKRASSMKMTISTWHNHVLLFKFRSTKMGPKNDVCFKCWSTFWWPPSSLNYPTSSSCMHGGIYFW